MEIKRGESKKRVGELLLRRSRSSPLITALLRKFMGLMELAKGVTTLGSLIAL